MNDIAPHPEQLYCAGQVKLNARLSKMNNQKPLLNLKQHFAPLNYLYPVAHKQRIEKQKTVSIRILNSVALKNNLCIQNEF
jgi:hypothetical protein